MLTRQRAEERFASMNPGIEYNLFLNLEEGKDFNGFGSYKFTLKNLKNVFLNYSGKNIQRLWINKTEVSGEELKNSWKEGNLDLEEKLLQMGENHVEVLFENSYNTDGNGLHSTIDADGKQYIYSQSEPFHTNRVYPVFDQPDLKGKMSFHFLCSKNWRIVANTDFSEQKLVSDFDLENVDS